MIAHLNVWRKCHDHANLTKLSILGGGESESEPRGRMLSPPKETLYFIHLRFSLLYLLHNLRQN